MAYLLRDAGRGRRVVACGLLLALCGVGLVACLSQVGGERAETGECPAGEVCSEATPEGLTFVGQAFWDNGDRLLLGPVLVGGTFEVGVKTMDGDPLPPFAFEAEDGSVFEVERGTGTFGPTYLGGVPVYPVDAHLVLSAVGAGTTTIRIVDPETGELFDRIAIEAYEVEAIEISNMNDPGRDYVLAGCEELLAVRLVAKNGGTQLRAFDQSVQLRANGVVRAEPQFWDCFSYEAAEGQLEVDVEVEAAGQVFTQTLEVKTLLEVELDACPVVRQRD